MLDTLLHIHEGFKRGEVICMVTGNSDRSDELLDVTIDEIYRPYEDLQGFESRLWATRENALIDGYAGLRMNLDLEDDTNVTSGVLEDCTVLDVKYTMKIIHLCDQVVVRKKGSTAFIMLKDRYGRIQ
jgi:hypothetical protein